MNNEINQKKQIQDELDRIDICIEECEEKQKQDNKPYYDKKEEVERLEELVKTLKHGFDGDETAFKEYKQQLNKFDEFRFFKSSNGTTTPLKRFGDVRIWGQNYLADRSLVRTFLHSFLTTLMNFDTPTLADITNGFTNRGGAGANGSTLVANTGGTNPTKFSAEWVLQEWNKYRDYFNKMVAVGAEAEIIKKDSDNKELSEIVLPSAIPVRNVAKFITANPNNTANISKVLFGSESFIPYHQQVKIQNSGNAWVDIKERELLEFLQFVFPNNIANNELLNPSNTANDYRLFNTVSNAKNYDLHGKDYKNLTLFPLYETSTTKPSAIQNTHGLDKSNIDLEWKYQNNGVDTWISKRYAYEFKNASTNNLNKFDGVVRLFHEVFATSNTNIYKWVNELSGWNTTTNAYDNDIDKISALTALMDGYADKSRLTNGSDIIPTSQPDSEEYRKKSEELELAKDQLEELEKSYKGNRSTLLEYKKDKAKLEKELEKFTGRDKRTLYNKIKSINNQAEATYDSTNKKWTIKQNRKFAWSFWQDFATAWDELLEKLGTDETKWEADIKTLVDKMKVGTHKYYLEVLVVNYNKLTEKYNRYIVSKQPKEKTIEQWLTEWIKNKDNTKNGEAIAVDLEQLKNFITIDQDWLNTVLEKISKSDLIRTDLENALKRVLGTDYTNKIKTIWNKSEYAQKAGYLKDDKFWQLVKPYYLITEQGFKDFVKKCHGSHETLQSWLKDPELNVEDFIACIRLYQIKQYVNLSEDKRKQEFGTPEKQKEILARFAECDDLNAYYGDITHATHTDWTAIKAYEELKAGIMKDIDKTLGLDKNTDASRIQEWINTKDYNTSDKIEKLLAVVIDEEKSEVKDGQKQKVYKVDFLTFAGVKDLTELLKDKTPAEVVATIKRFELKDLTEETVKSKTVDENLEKTKFDSEKTKLVEELEEAKIKLEAIEAVGIALTPEEAKIKTALITQIDKLKQMVKTETAPVPDKVETKGDDEENKEPKKPKDGTKTSQGDDDGRPLFYKAWWFWGIIVLAVIGIGVAIWYFMSKKNSNGKDQEGENQETE